MLEDKDAASTWVWGIIGGGLFGVGWTDVLENGEKFFTMTAGIVTTGWIIYKWYKAHKYHSKRRDRRKGDIK